MSSSSNLIIFNTNKKLVQLTKVSSNLRANLSEHFLHMETLETRYTNEFHNIFKDHEFIISEIISEVEKTRSDISGNISSLYSQQYSNIFEKYQKTIDSLSKEVNSENERTVLAIEKMRDEISQIKLKIEEINSQISEPLADIFTNATGGTITTLKEKYKEEIRIHDEESERKLSLLKEENMKKMSLFDSSYQKVAENLKKQFFSFSKDSEKMKIFAELKEKFNKANKEILLIKNLFEENDKKIFLVNYNSKKEEISSLINERNRDLKEFVQKKSEIDASIESQNNELDNILNSLMNDQNSQKNKFCCEITEVQSQIAQTILDNKVELEKKERFLQSNSNLSNEEFEELKKQLLKEYEALKAENESLYPPLTEKNNQLSKILKEINNKNFEEKNIFSNQLTALKNEHSKEKDVIKEQQDDDKHVEFARYEARMAVILKKLGQSKNLISDTEIANEEIIKLENELKENKNHYEVNLLEFTESFEEEKKNLSSKNEEELYRIREEEEKHLFDLNNEINNSLDNSKNEHELIKSDLVNRLENEYKNTLEDIPQSFQNDGVIKDLIEQYAMKYKEMAQIKNSLVNENCDENQRESNEKLLNDTIKEKDDLLKLIICEKEKTNKNYESDEKNEKERHELAMSLFYFNEFDDYISKLEQIKQNNNIRIEELIHKHDSLLFELQKLKEGKTSESILLASGFLDDEEITKLRKFLEILREDLKNQRHKKQAEFEDSINVKNKEIIETEEKLKSLIIQETEEQKQNTIKSKELLEKLKEDGKQKMISLQKTYYIEKSSIKERIEKAKKEIEEKLRLSSLQIKDEKRNLLLNQKTLNKEIDQNRAENDSNLDKLGEESSKELMKIREISEKFFSRLEKRLKDADEACKNAKTKAENIPMRPEERSIVKRLEDMYDQKSQQLTVIAKDLMGYRNKLKQQEDEYNRRFGVAPQVAILHGSQANGRGQAKSAQVSKKPLPPLKNSTVC